MPTYKSVTLSLTNRTNIDRVYKHVAVYLGSLLGYSLPSHQETLFMHGKGQLNIILLCWCSQYRNWDRRLLCHILSFLPNFPPNIWRIMMYSQTEFDCEISPAWIFVMALSTSPEEYFLLLFFIEGENIILRSNWSLSARTMEHGSYFLAVSVT